MVLEKLIFAVPPNRAPDELRIIWAQVTSPCIAENASILISIVFLASLLLSFIKSRVCNGLGKTREVRNHLKKDVKYGASYNVTAVCSVLSFIGQVASLLLVYLGNSNVETQCESKEMLLWSRSMQGISWALTLVTLYKIRDRKSIRFPWILRLWWISSFLLSLWHATLDARFVMSHGQLRVQEYAELTGFLASFCLLVLSIQGNIAVAPSLDQEASEPLLNGKHENQSSLRNDCPYGRATLIQLVTFSWLNPLFEVGFKKTLDQEDVPNLDANDSAAFLSQQFDGCLKYTKEQGSTSTASIYKSIYLFIRKKAVINAVFAVTSAGTSYVGPYLMNNFVTFLNEKKYRSLQSGYLLALGFLGAKLVETIAQRQWIFGARQLGLRLRSALISHIYKKGLALTSTSRQSRTSGEMINFMSVDVQRITDFIWYMNTIWMLPVQIGLAMYILQLNLGMGALVSFVAVLIVMAINIPMTTYQKRYQTKIMEAKDDRMKATSEVLRNMKTLKLQAWDSYYLEKIENLRKIEHNWLFKSQRLNALGAFIFWGSPAFISVVSFCGCYIMGIPLTAGTVLSSLATFRMLQDPIFNLPDLLNIIAQGKVSVDRISSYLQEDEIQVDAVENTPGNYTYQVEIDSGRFSWDKDSINPTLDQINMRVKRGMKVAICGTVGSGKSSLLSCILGEMHKLVGTVKISGSKAYVPQSAWILTGNIRENIIFGRPYESEKYLRVIEACALAKDFELFAAGDLTEIGERGINMSGGQKQRIQIARAVYQDADVYLLDDPFSAVDAHTGTRLYQDCLMGILKEKTVLYVTHQIEFLHAADLILVMQNGKIAQAGTFQELLEQNIGFEVLVGAHSQALESVRTVNTSSRTCEHVPKPVENENDSDNTGNHEFLQSKQDSEHNLSVEITEKDGRLVQDEEREKGSISKEVYMSYLTTVKRGTLIPIILLAQTSFQALQITSNYWMAWACPNAKSQPTVPINIVLLIYALLGLGSALCVLLRASLVAITGLFTSEKLFSKMLHSVLRAPMAFFDSTPTGRILNRASMDQSVLDLEMANKLGWCAFSVIQLLGTIAVMSQVAWEVFAIFIPVTGICIWYQRYYNPTARELARLSGIRRAPILHHFSESLTGASTIRAFNHQKRFTDINLRLIDNHSRPWFHNVSAMEWLSFRLNQLSNFVFGFSLILLVSLPDGIINPSIAGLAVTYGINLNVLQASVIWNICNAENKMISVERILQYSNLASEGPLIIEDCRPPVYWPHLGSISFTNLQIRYAEHLPSVLKDITCTFPGRRKVGVVGRTGSGKSTLIQAIFRIVEAREGSVAIDNIDISKIGLHDLRQRLSIIPQDPAMFEGSVRGNLDPLGQYPDHEIWRALDKCQLGDLVRQKPEKLEAVVVENGENWSVGQRQLFCLGRALLKKSSILVLDEATASVDSATDGIIQKIIGEEFKERTVITIAHRIHTVIDSDLVLVLSDGRIAEYDTPSKLLEQENSLFSKLIKEYSMKSQSLK